MRTTCRRRGLLTTSATLALAITATAATPALAVVPNEETTSDDIVDTDDEYRGVGMFFRADGFVCTGTLINPRTVLFAAHCVNDIPATDYNADNIPAAWSFNVDALPGFQSWFANNFASNPDLAVYNVNRIYYDPRSLQNPQANGFIEADIALASLDTPATGIPTWALLFSTLPAPTAIDPVTGTGYAVDIVGYGATGNALRGAVEGIDFRRRAAENMLGGFLSLDDRNAVLFGSGSGLPQNLYQLDFDSQDRDAVFDINVHRDDARPNEGITAGGDSGGPLILDAADNTLSDEDLVIGVLSGGSRFFGGQPFSSLGGTSFYQPLSLYWQYIVETNPYRYVGTQGGNGNWEDPEHWVTLLDPVYRVIDDTGVVVNGLPTTHELGLAGTEGDYGAVCIEFEEPGDGCVDVATGEFEDTFTAPVVESAGNAGARATGDSRGTVDVDLITGGENVALPASIEPGQSGAAGGASASLAASGGAPVNMTGTLPDPTLANGLPGATGFVPDNVDPVVSADPAVNVDPRYYDVTLAGTGTTTLSSTVTIDRLTVRDNAGLSVASAGALTSLIDINQFGGHVNVNGSLTSAGDYTLFAGMLEGTGTVRAPFVTSVTGVFSPATMGTIGALTIDGNLVMSSGSTFLVDLAADGTSDLIAVTGIADVGGVVGLGTGVTQQVNGNGQIYTILTAEGGVTGAFTETALSAILTQSFIYEDTAVLMEIEAGSYADVIDDSDSVQAAYAQLFDQNRTNAELAGLYGLDFADADTIRTTFEALAPVNEQAVRAMSAQSVNLLQNFYDTRLRDADKASAGGKIAVKGAPLSLAQAGLMPMGQPIGAAALAMQDGGDDTEMVDANLPDNLAIFVAGGIVSGDSDALPGYAAGSEAAGVFITRDNEFDGFYLAGGLEFYPGEATMIGVSGYYSSLEGDIPLGQSVDNDTLAGTIYARHKLGGGAVLDGQISLGTMGFDTLRNVQFLDQSQSLSTSSDDFLISGALGLSYDIETGIGTISPGVEGRYASVDLTTVTEDGGILALNIAREKFESTQARAGLDWETQAEVVQINAIAQYVHEFKEGPQLLVANFAQGTGPDAAFLLNQADSDWVELGISLQAGRGPMQLGIGFDTTIGRGSADARAVRASATYRF